MKRFVIRALVVLFALLTLRFVVGAGWGALHYWTTQPFDEFVRSHPVEAGFAERLFGGTDTEALMETRRFGPLDPLTVSTDSEEENAEFERGTRLIEIEITRGDELLGRVRQLVHATLRREDHRYHGLAIEPPEVVTHPELRAVVALRLSESTGELGVDRRLGGRLELNFFLLSGHGDPIVRLSTDGAAFQPVPGLEETKLTSLWWRALTGITHEIGGPPDEGLVHHVSTFAGIDWTKDPENRSSGGPSSGFLRHYGNSGEYSYSVRMAMMSSLRGEEPKPGLEQTRRASKTWNGETW